MGPSSKWLGRPLRRRQSQLCERKHPTGSQAAGDANGLDFRCGGWKIVLECPKVNWATRDSERSGRPIHVSEWLARVVDVE